LGVGVWGDEGERRRRHVKTPGKNTPRQGESREKKWRQPKQGVQRTRTKPLGTPSPGEQVPATSLGKKLEGNPSEGDEERSKASGLYTYQGNLVTCVKSLVFGRLTKKKTVFSRGSRVLREIQKPR